MWSIFLYTIAIKIEEFYGKQDSTYNIHISNVHIPNVHIPNVSWYFESTMVYLVLFGIIFKCTMEHLKCTVVLSNIP